MKKISPNLIIVIGSVIGVLSFFLPWVKMDAWITEITASAFSLINQSNISILILVIIAFFLALGLSVYSFIKEHMMKPMPIIIIVLGGFALIGLIGAAVTINELEYIFFEINLQFGIVLSLVGALAVIAGGVLSLLGVSDVRHASFKNLKNSTVNSAKTFWQENSTVNSAKTFWQENSNFPQTRAGSNNQYSTGQQRQSDLQQQGWNQNQQPYQQAQNPQWQSNQQQAWEQPQPQDQYPQWQSNQHQDWGGLEHQDQQQAQPPQWQANQQQDWNLPSQPQQPQQPSQPDQTWQSNQQPGWGQQPAQPTQFQQTDPYVQPWRSGQQQPQEPPAWQKRTQKPPAWLINNQSPQSQTNPNSEDPEQTG